MTLRSDAESVYADGVPPNKDDVLGLWSQVSSLISALLEASGSGALVFENKAAMDADLAHNAATMAWVMTDSVDVNNGIFKKSGASGSGSWVKQSGFSFQPAIDAALVATQAAITVSGNAQVARVLSIFPEAIYPTTAAALSNGVASATFVGGSGGTNGTYIIAATGGSGSNALALVTVTGGAITAVRIISKGYNYATVPSFSTSSITGLTGGSITAQLAINEPVGDFFGVSPPAAPTVNIYDLYENVAGVATARGSAPLGSYVASIAGIVTPVVKAGLILDSDGVAGQMAFDTLNGKFFMPKPASGKWDQPWIMTRDTLPPASVVGLWFAKDISGGIMPNRVAPSSATNPAKVLTRCPRECFETGAVGDYHWLNIGLTATRNYAADLDGTMTAMRLVSTGPGVGSIQHRSPFSRGAGDYVFVANIQANTSSQNFEWTRDGGSNWNAFTLGTTMAQQKFAFTLSGTTTLDLRIRPAAGVTGDFNAGKVYLWDGNSASVPADLIFGGHGYIGDTPGVSVSVVSNALRLATGQCIHFDLPARYVGAAGTLVAVTRRLNATSSSGFSDVWLHDVLTNTSGLSVSLGEAELGSSAFQLKANFQKSMVVPLGGFSPNLYSPRNDINAFVFAAGGDGMELWMGDCLIQQELTSPAPTTRTIQHLQCGISNGFDRNHEIFALAYAPVKLTADERRQLLKYIEDELARDSKTLFRPRNHIHVDLDSLTVGPSNNGWAQQMLAGLSHPAYVLQDAIGGSTLTAGASFQLNLINRLPAILNGMPQTAETRNGRSFPSIIVPGANDIQPNYASEAAFLTAFEAQVAQLRAKGRKAIIVEPLHKGTAASGYATHNTRVDNIRTTLAGWVAAGKCDAVVVVSGNANIGTFASTSNATYWNTGDGIHLTAAGQTELKNLILPVVNSFLLAV